MPNGAGKRKTWNRRGWLGGDETKKQPMRCSASWGREGRERERGRERGNQGWGWDSHSEGKGSHVMLLDVNCSPLTGLCPFVWVSQGCVCKHYSLALPVLGDLLLFRPEADWLVTLPRLSAEEGGWLERRSRLGQGRAGCQAICAGPHRRKTWVFLCSRSEQCSALWPWWPTGCLRLCPHLWDSMGPPSPEGAPQKGLLVWVRLNLLFWKCVLVMLEQVPVNVKKKDNNVRNERESYSRFKQEKRRFKMNELKRVW